MPQVASQSPPAPFTYWYLIVRKIGRHPVTIRCVDLARSHAVAAGEVMSIVGCIAWLVPCCLYPDYLHTSPYLMRVSEHLPQPVIIGIFAALLFFQAHALLMVPRSPANDLYLTRERYSRARVQWMERRAVGLRIAMFVWAVMAYLFTIDRWFTSGSITYGFLVILCLIGQYVVGQVEATSEREWPALLKIVDEAEMIADEREKERRLKCQGNLQDNLRGR